MLDTRSFCILSDIFCEFLVTYGPLYCGWRLSSFFTVTFVLYFFASSMSILNSFYSWICYGCPA